MSNIVAMIIALPILLAGMVWDQIVSGVLFLWRAVAGKAPTTASLPVNSVVTPGFYGDQYSDHVNREPVNQEVLAQNMQRNAGAKAENHVANTIEKWMLEHGDRGIAMHGKIFEFNNGLKSEYSAEADHIYVGQFGIYVIETKYKSGTISAQADGEEWGVERSGIKSTMRNALSQVNNTARVLKSELELDLDVVPMVVIFGNPVTLRDNPSNVVVANDLMRVIQVFEDQAAKCGKQRISTDRIALVLEARSCKDPDAMARHVERIEKKLKNRQLDRVIESASAVV